MGQQERSRGLKLHEKRVKFAAYHTALFKKRVNRLRQLKRRTVSLVSFRQNMLQGLTYRLIALTQLADRLRNSLHRCHLMFHLLGNLLRKITIFARDFANIANRAYSTRRPILNFRHKLCDIGRRFGSLTGEILDLRSQYAVN